MPATFGRGTGVDFLPEAGVPSDFLSLAFPLLFFLDFSLAGAGADVGAVEAFGCAAGVGELLGWDEPGILGSGTGVNFLAVLGG